MEVHTEFKWNAYRRTWNILNENRALNIHLFFFLHSFASIKRTNVIFVGEPNALLHNSLNSGRSTIQMEIKCQIQYTALQQFLCKRLVRTLSLAAYLSQTLHWPQSCLLFLSSGWWNSLNTVKSHPIAVYRNQSNWRAAGCRKPTHVSVVLSCYTSLFNY